MCGIAGATGTPDTNIKVKKMLVALEHRGPMPAECIRQKI